MSGLMSHRTISDLFFNLVRTVAPASQNEARVKMFQNLGTIHPQVFQNSLLLRVFALARRRSHDASLSNQQSKPDQLSDESH